MTALLGNNHLCQAEVLIAGIKEWGWKIPWVMHSGDADLLAASERGVCKEPPAAQDLLELLAKHTSLLPLLTPALMLTFAIRHPSSSWIIPQFKWCQASAKHFTFVPWAGSQFFSKHRDVQGAVSTGVAGDYCQVWKLILGTEALLGMSRAWKNGHEVPPHRGISKVWRKLPTLERAASHPTP